ncbi:MAG: hypothetical protein NTU85_03700, partial [Candidatus Kaiserbacteria bacterium]|nr:hypothetical protein [Candidatus Kaiserbacteria bacterium]
MGSKQGSISFYLIATIVLMVSSLIGVLVLIRKNQDNRNKAFGICPGDQFYCGGCINACRNITNKTCNQLIAEECGPQNQKWTNCTSGGGLTISDRCVSAPNLDAALSLCSGSFPLNGCNDPNFTKNTSNALCFKDNFCGAQQIDIFTPQFCWVHIEDHTACTVPTNIPPVSTPIPTKTPTLTPKPTNTPTGTLVPTKTPTLTPKPTNTPTGTLVPSKTPTLTPKPTNTP